MFRHSLRGLHVLTMVFKTVMVNIPCLLMAQIGWRSATRQLPWPVWVHFANRFGISGSWNSESWLVFLSFLGRYSLVFFVASLFLATDGYLFRCIRNDS